MSDAEMIRLIINALLLCGIAVGIYQVRAALRVSRANVLLKLLEEWNSRNLYTAIRYINRLRMDWRTQEPDEAKWERLAEQWVSERAEADSDSNDIIQKRLTEEWFQRRLVAQFISRMASLLRSRYITKDDFFTVVPEVQRLILVLEPIDNAIIKYYADKENIQTEKGWDRPMRKTAYQYVKDQHNTWFKQHGTKF